MSSHARRPGLITTLCVINTIIALASLLGGIMLIVMQRSLSATFEKSAKLTPSFANDPELHATMVMGDKMALMIQPFILAAAAFLLLIAAALAVVTVGLARMRAWARVAMLTLAWVWLGGRVLLLLAMIPLPGPVWETPSALMSVAEMLFVALVIAVLRSGFIKNGFIQAERERAIALPSTPPPLPAAA